MLCAHAYGFVIPAAPAIFIDFSPTSADVTAALQSFISTKQIVPPPNLRWTRPADTVEYLHRATAMIHERRHFHDLLATPLGNHLFFSGVNFAITLLTTLDRRARRGVPILLPLRCGVARMIQHHICQRSMHSSSCTQRRPAGEKLVSAVA